MLHRNFPLKAASILLAVFLWFWVMLNEQNPVTENVVQAPVAVADIADGLTARHTPTQVEVKLRGLRQDMTEVNLNDAVTASITCRGLGVGDYELEVKVEAPSDLTVLHVRPDTVSVILEEAHTARFPVEIEEAGEAPSGQVVALSCSPSSVLVSGAASQVDRTVRVRAVVDVGSIDGDDSLQVPTRAVDENGADVPGVTIDPPLVKVAAAVRPTDVAKTVPVVLDARGALPADLRLVAIQVDPSAVSITAPPAQAQEVTKIDTAELQLSSIHGNTTRAVRLIAPDGVTLVGGDVARVIVTVAHAAPAEMGEVPPAP